MQWIRDVIGLIAFFLFLFPGARVPGFLIFESIEERLEHSRNFKHNAFKNSQLHDQKTVPQLPDGNERVNLVPLKPSHPLATMLFPRMHRASRSEDLLPESFRARRFNARILASVNFRLFRGFAWFH